MKSNHQVEWESDIHYLEKSNDGAKNAMLQQQKQQRIIWLNEKNNVTCVVQLFVVIIQLKFVVTALNKERNKKGLWHLKCIMVDYKCCKEWVEKYLQVWTHNHMKESVK